MFKERKKATTQKSGEEKKSTARVEVESVAY